ncbi:MAG: VWA domain-containing protein, partial [Gammaproteobacteria bacterium]|nr:VWA domain-containing protein [Gammaproteobacteria bacterium]
AAPENADVRVLIDISGSMRQNDPDNLRRPALRMLAGLMQPGTRAGVWTFARWVNNLVPVADVDAAWKKRTQSLSEQISSPGQFTNIEDVLERASRDWEGAPATHARHLVLLTDGMVDVSKNPDDNAQSRARILDTLLPRLKQAEVKIHTIALSERADHALMQRLAGETGGWYQQVESADQLQRAFLKMFETVGKPDAIPLQDNRFVVDGSINEATVLVFSKPGAPAVVLRSPAGDEYTDSDLTAGVAWSRDQGYDLITIAAPQKGEWNLQADVDPDNRVMIVTDLKLQTSEIPTHLAVGEQAHIEAYLNNRGQLVDRQAFLRLLEVRADAITADGSDPQPLNDAGEDGDATARDGRYSMQFDESRPHANLELLVSVDSPTFMREKRFRLAIHEVAEAAVETVESGLRFTLQTNVAVLQDGAEVSAWQEDAAGQRLQLTLTGDGKGAWAGDLSDPQAAVYAEVTGTSRLGNLLNRRIGPIMPPGVPAPVAQPEPEPAPAVAEVVESPPVVEMPVPEPAVEPESVADPEPAAEQEPETESWVMPAIVFGGFNLLLMIGGGVWWWLRRRRAAPDDDLDLDALIDDGDEAAADPAAGVQEDAA